MNVAHAVYEGLLEEYGGAQEVFLETLIRQGCGYRHVLRLEGAESKADRPETLILHEVSLRVRTMIGRYLRGTFPKEWSTGTYVTRGGITMLVDGFLGDDTLVEVCVLSKDVWSGTKAPRVGVLSAATKAYETGRTKAVLVSINRDSQEWMFWTVGGDFEEGTKAVRADMDHVGGMVSGKIRRSGFAGERTCRTCPFTQACEVGKIHHDPPRYEAPGIEVRAAVDIRQQVEAHLWRLNQRANGRTKSVIHPSSFALERCDREIGYDLQGVDEQQKIDPRLRRIFDTGHCWHDTIQETLESKLPHCALEVRTWHKELKISGSCDGVIDVVTNEDGLEIKSIGSKGYAKLTKAKAEHERQATIYGAILGLTHVIYLYANKETGELALYRVPLNKSVWHKQATRAGNINKTVDAGDLPPRIDKKYLCEKCKYAWTCKPDLVGPPNPQKRKFR